MNRTKLADKVFEVGNDINFTAYKLYSAIDLLRILVESADEDGLLDECPLNGLRGTLALFESVSEDMTQAENKANDMIKMQSEVCKEFDINCITNDVLSALKTRGMDVSATQLQIKFVSENRYVVFLNTKQIGIWDSKRIEFLTNNLS